MTFAMSHHQLRVPSRVITVIEDRRSFSITGGTDNCDSELRKDRDNFFH